MISVQKLIRPILMLSLLLLIVSGMAGSAGDYISTDKDEYALGEIVTIELSGTSLSGKELKLVSEYKTYSYPSPVSRFKFIPDSAGEHRLYLLDKGTQVSEKLFYVHDSSYVKDNSLPSVPPSISIEKIEFSKGEPVDITVTGDLEGIKLMIISKKNTFDFLGDLKNEIRFLPKEEGIYEIQLKNGGYVAASKIFYVLNPKESGEDQDDALVGEDSEGVGSTDPLAEDKISDITEDSSGADLLDEEVPADKEIDISADEDDLDFSKDSASIQLKVKNSKGYFYFTDATVSGVSKNSGKVRMDLNTLSSQPLVMDIYDVDIYPDLEGIKKIRLNDVDLRKGFELGLEPIEGKENGFGNAKNSFAIDPSTITFSNGSLDINASGNILMKCSSWNFTEQSCPGGWEKIKDITPGEIYTIDIDAYDPAFVEVGLATINTNKSTYVPGESAKITIVALDSNGYLVPGADVSLEVITPGQDNLSFSTEDEIIEESRGIYTLIFDEIEEVGTFSLFVSVSGQDVGNSMFTTFDASYDHAFDILRDIPVTIDPKKGPFESKIKLISRGYAGNFSYTEKLPLNITVTDVGDADITYDEAFQYINWGGIENGTEISYMFEVPPDTPEHYFIGPGIVSYGTEGYEEARPWILAVDPVYGGEFFLLWDGASDAPSGWTCVSCSPGDPFYDRFPMGSVSYGRTGGSSTTQPTMSLVSISASALNDGRTGAVNSGAIAGHTHSSLTNPSVSEESLLPQFRSLKVIAFTGGIPSTIPSDAIAFFNDTSLPAGWTRYSSQDTYFVRGGSSVATGGSNTHSHSVSAGLDTSSGSATTRTGGTEVNVAADAHTHTSGSTSTSNLDHRPPYIDVILAKADSDTSIPYAQGFIAMFNQTPPEGWKNMSNNGDPFYQRFPVGSSSFGTTGGSSNHQHANTAITTGVASTTVLARSAQANFALGTHTHDITVSFSQESNLPPYIEVVFGYADQFVQTQDEPPSVSLVSPEDYYNSSSRKVTFTCSASDEFDLVNISLYTNISGTFQQQSSTDIIGSENTSYTAIFEVSNIPNQTVFVWNCLAYDNSSNTAWATSNRTVTINENPDPIVTLSSPPDLSVIQDTSVQISCSAEDDEDISSLALYTTRNGAFSFEQVALFPGTSDTSVSHTFTQSGFQDASTYYWNCKAIDNESIESFGLSNYSFSVYLGKPNMTLDSPADKTVTTDTDISLTCTGRDSEDVERIDLYTDRTGSFQVEDTVYFTGDTDTEAQVVFNLTGLDYGDSFNWNCRVTDNRSLTAFAASNWSVAVANLDHFYGSLSQGTWSSASNAEGYPDGAVATQQLDDQLVLSMDDIEGVPTIGSLLGTYLSLAWYASSSTGNDQLDLGYSLSDYDANNLNLDGTAYTGATSASSFPTGSVQNQSYEITGTLTTSDLSSMRLRIMGDQVTGPDNNPAYIDSLYLSILFDYYPIPLSSWKVPSAVFQYDVADFYSNWSDDYFLDCYIFAINMTGSWANSSCIPFDGLEEATANYSMNITAIPGTIVEWRFYANDSRGQMNSSEIKRFVVADPNDIMSPAVTNEQVYPVINSSGSTFNISATITDNYAMDRAYAEITSPSGVKQNYSMSNQGSTYYYMYQPSAGGNYSFRIIAFDAVNNSGISSTSPTFFVTSVVSTPQKHYQRGDNILITGRGYNASSAAELNVYMSNGTALGGYPVIKTTNTQGTFTHTLSVSGSLGTELDTYTIEGNDTSVPSLWNSTEIYIVIKPDSANKYDDNTPLGQNVLSLLNFSDDQTTLLVSDATEAYINMRFQDQILEGYTLDDIVLYVEHQDYDAGSNPIVVQYFDGSVYQTATCASIPFSSSNTVGMCNLTADIASLPNPNDIRLRLTDNNVGTEGTDFSRIDIAYLDIDFSITNSLAVEILVPTNDISSLGYPDANNLVYGGTSTTIQPGTQQTGTEATSTEYSRLESSDDQRFQSTATGRNNYAYQSYYLYTSLPESDIVSMTLDWEGYITNDGTVPIDIRIFAWNYQTGVYDDLNGAAITGSTTDQTIEIEFTGTMSDYVDTDGEINIYVTGNQAIQGNQIRQDIFTDFINLDIYSISTISGYQDINISAVDADGVQNCTIHIINSSDLIHDTKQASKLTDYTFYNLTYTGDYPDGIYNISATCTDTVEYVSDSVLVRINNQGPNVTLITPIEGAQFTYDDINFTWNASQDAGNPVCDLYIDSIINQSSITSPNGQYKSFIVNDISDGPHTWTVVCRNGAGIEGTTETRNFTVDTSAPLIYLDYPSDESYVDTGDITFLYTPYDTGILNCSIYVDDVFEAENTTVESNQQSSFYVTGLGSGMHNWSVYCTDSFGYTSQSSVYNFYVDLYDPWIYLSFPEPGDVFLGGLVSFNYTAYDDYDYSLECDLIINGITEFSDVASANNTPIVLNKELTSGVKWWNVTCIDDSGRYNTSETRNFTVNGYPTVTLQSPANQTSWNVFDISLKYFAEDTGGIENCSLYVNSQYNDTDYAVESGAINDFNLTDQREAHYDWYVRCFDNMDLPTTSGKYYYTIDRTIPNITLLKPDPAQFFDDGDISFNFTAYDNLDSYLTCTLYIDGVPEPGHTDFEVQNNSFQSRYVTGILGGDHLWDVECSDDSGLTAYSPSRSFTVGGIPSVTLQYPYNGSYSKGDISFIYFVQDNDAVSNCSLYINDVFNQTDTSINNAQNNTFILNNVPEQDLNWSVYCTDSLSLTGYSGNFMLTVDNTAPSVSLIAPNATTFTSGDVTFNFTASENTASDLYCNITVDDTVEDLNFMANNGFNSRSLSGFLDGIHYWNVTCVDEAGWYSSVQETYNFTVSEAPEVMLLNPPDDSTDTDGDIIFDFQVNNNNIQNCSLYLNETLYSTIYSGDIVPYGTSSISATGLSAGIWNWTVGCFNTNDVAANATNGPWKVHVDFNPPNVSLSEPVDDANISLSTITFNFTAYDDVDDYLSCNLSVSGMPDTTGISAENGVPQLVPVGGFVPGNYYWNVTCSDGGYSNTSETRNFSVSSQPTIDLISPQDDYSDLDGDVTFIYRPSTINESGFLACRLFIDDVLNQTNASLTSDDNGVELSFFAPSISEGYHNWSINCTDFAGENAVSEYRDFIVDLTDPSVTLTFPDGQELNSSFSFNFTATDNIDSSLTCSLNNNGTIINGLSATDAIPYLYPISGLTDGIYSWNVTCYDDAGRFDISPTYTYSVNETPTISLISPADEFRTKETALDFFYLPSDNSGQLDGCSIYINDVLNKTNTTIYEGINNNFSISGFDNGRYNWSVSCIDPAGKTGYSDHNDFMIDLFGPSIDMIFPENEGTYNFDNINFTWNATDEFGTDIWCNLTIDDQVNQSDLYTVSGQIYNITVNELERGRHNWSLTCWDDLNNTASTSMYNFTVNAPDLTLNSSHIVFNNTNPDLYETLNITATIFNIGGATAYDVPIEFYDGLPGTGARIGETQIIPSIATGTDYDVSVLWNITEGLHDIYVIINYTGVELNVSNNNATASISALQSMINYPGALSYTTENPTELNITLTDYTGGLINLTVYVDGSPVLYSNSTDSVAKLVNISLSEGMRSIYVRATDYLGRQKDSDTIIRIYDRTSPSVNLFSPQNNSWNNTGQDLVFVYYAEDSVSLDTCMFYLDGSLNQTNSTPSNAAYNSFFVGVLDEGMHNWSVSCNDTLGNMGNSTAFYYTVDKTAPAVSLEYPEDGFNSSTSSIMLNYSVTDNLDGDMFCSLMIDSETIQSGVSSQNGSTVSTLVADLSEGSHSWNVTCEDDAGNFNTSETRTFNIFVPPIITLISPENNNWTNSASATFFFNVSDDTGIENCSLILNSAIYTTKYSADILNNGTNNFTANGLDGTYDWAVECYDNTSMNMYSIEGTRRLYVDLYDPVPKFETQSMTWFNIINPLIYFNITDNMDTVLDYIIYVDKSLNVSGTAPNGSSESASLDISREGQYNLTLEGIDEASNRANSTDIVIYVDTTEPTIQLNSPLDGVLTESKDVALNFSATDNLAWLMTCDVMVDSSVRATLSAYNDSFNETIVSGLGAGMHYWNVTCTDIAGNSNTSDTWSFTVPLPDLTLNSTHIGFNTTMPEEGTNITINATIFNLGNSDAEDVVVQFFNGNYSLGNQIGSNQTVTVASNSNSTVEISWLIPDTGNFDIYVVVDPDIDLNGSIYELDETNNFAHRMISISSYQFLVGNFTGNLNIDQNSTNRTIFRWSVYNFTGSHIFAADYDSVIEWDSLTAFGRSTTGVSQFDDFSELDSALGIADNSDSINNTWTEANSPRQTDTFKIFNKDISEVPVANSTVNSDFMTGILWDSSDPGPGDVFDANQDVVFVTRVKTNTTGYLGNYDYEMRVPSSLKSYFGPNTQIIALYTEII